ncbi:hypothetical protein AOB60_25760 [Streptomyces noursei]|uniref:Uncharacterized protein n=1 Tax=Streptomyces noursei TaxID=1971 RepID=A0A2N8P9M3_STRNR|nr:hypothetical protein AOB60_25760 [Streptomyces noursei]
MLGSSMACSAKPWDVAEGCRDQFCWVLAWSQCSGSTRGLLSVLKSRHFCVLSLRIRKLPSPLSKMLQFAI